MNIHLVSLDLYLTLSVILFTIGSIGVMTRRNAIIIFMSIELMLNAVAVNLVAFGTLVYPGKTSGLVFAVFVITVAAAELGLGLAIVLRVYRMRSSVNVDEVDLMRW